MIGFAAACRRASRGVLLLCLPVVSPSLSAAQVGSDPVYTLKAQSRLVIEDVLVTDAQGRPVHGLPASAFHVFDEDRPQVVRRFEEGAAELPKRPMPARPAGEFSNADVMGSRTASEVLLIDSDDLEITDQMFLLAQLRKAIATMPRGLPVAVFRVTNGKVVQLRGFSTDREDLIRAVGEGFPVMTHNIDSEFQSAVEQLMTVSAFLQQVPGRKSVLWFAGAFPLVPVADDDLSVGGSANYAARQRIIHQIQEALAEARVSVYPVDVRGVLLANLPPLGGNHDMQARAHAAELAAATGGKAYVLNNLAEEVNEAFELGMRAYTLEYVPTPYATDESWHRVRVTVDGNYRLSYRFGYLATDTGLPGGRQGFRLENGQKVSTDLSRDALKPLLFTVKLAPEPGVAAKGAFRMKIAFQIPAGQVQFVRHGERWQDELLVCSYAYDGQGRMKGGKLQAVNTSLTGEQWPRAKEQQIAAEQTIAVPKDAGYLVLAVRDKSSRRIGTYLLPMRAVRALPVAGGVSE